MSATSKGGLFAVCGSFIALSTISVGIRFYARMYQQLRLGLDDWTAFFGVVTFIATASIALHLAIWNESGYGNPTTEQMRAVAKTTAQLSFAYDFLNLNTLACVKLSVLFMYRRIFLVDRHGWFNRVILMIVVIVALWYITSDFLSLYQCPGHFSAIWDGQFKRFCVLNPVWAKELAISDFVLDVLVLLLPIAPMMRLHTTLIRKLSIIGIFLLASVGLGASIARMVFFTEAKGASRSVVYISMLESGISITIVNLPSIFFFYASVKPQQILGSLYSLRRLGSSENGKNYAQSDIAGEAASV